MASMRDIGALVQLKPGIDTTNQSGDGSINGTGLDRRSLDKPMSCVLYCQNGAATGSPTSYTVDCKLQHSDDNSTWSDLTGAAVDQITADNSDEYVDIDLSGAKRYVRAVVTVAFTGGTSPAVPVNAAIVLGGQQEVPE